MAVMRTIACAFIAGLIASGGTAAWAQGVRLQQVEVWPRGATAAEPGKHVPSGTAEVVKKAVPAGTRVEQYLFVKLEDGALLVGSDPVNAPARTQRAAFVPKLGAGRGLRTEDRDKAVVITSRQYAETRKTAAGYKLAEMVYPGHVPGLLLGKTRVEVVGIFEAPADSDKLVIAPLAFAQTFAGTPDAVGLITVTVRSAADAETTKKALESSLKGTVDVRIAK